MYSRPELSEDQLFVINKDNINPNTQHKANTDINSERSLRTQPSLGPYHDTPSAFRIIRQQLVEYAINTELRTKKMHARIQTQESTGTHAEAPTPKKHIQANIRLVPFEPREDHSLSKVTKEYYLNLQRSGSIHSHLILHNRPRAPTTPEAGVAAFHDNLAPSITTPSYAGATARGEFPLMRVR